MATKTIGATGRDYATLPLWIAYLNGLGTLAAPEIGEMYNDGEFAGSASNMDINAPVTSVSNTITLRAATGQSFMDHATKATNPLIYDQSKGVGINLAGSQAHLRCSVNYFTLERIQIKRSSALYGQAVFEVNTGPTSQTVLVQNCIFGKDATGTNTVVEIRRQIIRNCLIYDSSASANIALRFGSGYSGGYALNCTVVKNNASAGGTGISASYTPRAVNNCAVFHFTTAFATASGGSYTGNYNATDAASGAPGANSQHNVSFSTSVGAKFVSLTADFRIQDGSALQNAGNTDATNAPLDIIGTTRGLTTAGDIGAWEVEAAGQPTGKRFSGTRGIGFGMINRGVW